MDRVSIGCNYRRQPFWKILLGVPLIYLPILTTVPFVAVGVILIRIHLRYVGGMNIKRYDDFVPAWISHRYANRDQPTLDLPRLHPAHHRIFWVFNCKLYCPLSVALFRYALYLVKIVENWWCPFGHDRKHDYAEGAIDRSFWHVDPEDRMKLHPDDDQNPIWNDRGSGTTPLPHPGGTEKHE